MAKQNWQKKQFVYPLKFFTKPTWHKQSYLRFCSYNCNLQNCSKKRKKSLLNFTEG